MRPVSARYAPSNKMMVMAAGYGIADTYLVDSSLGVARGSRALLSASMASVVLAISVSPATAGWHL